MRETNREINARLNLKHKIAKQIQSAKKVEMKIHNHTPLSLESIQTMPIVGRIKNNWRQRDVVLYASSDPTKLYMVGIAHDASMMVISHEDIGMNEGIAMDYWKNGRKILVRD